MAKKIYNVVDEIESEDKREVRTTCDSCECNLYDGDEVWGNNQIGVYCEKCALDEIAEWWHSI